MPGLDEEVQAFIVQAHACFRKPSLILKDVKAEFGVELVRQQVLWYHPERGGKKKRLAEKWRVLFAETRKAFVENKVEVGIKHQSYRLLMLQRIADRAEETTNLGLAMQVAEQAAKEEGGAFTNRRELTGRGGRPIELSTEDRRRELAVKMYEKLRARGKSNQEARDELVSLGVDERYIPVRGD